VSEGFLAYGRQSVDDDDIAAVTAVLRGDWLTTGPAVEAFEAALAGRVGAQAAVVVNSGTAALHLCAMALDLAPDDQVVVPSVTFLATANCVRYVGAEVVFCDVEPDTGLIDLNHLERLLRADVQGRIKAILPVHMAGQCADLAALAGLIEPRGITVIEDACHALGATDASGRPVGGCAYSRATVFSFHPVKTVTSGEGGAITTNDAALARRLRRLRSHGMVREPELFALPELAFDGDGSVNPWYYEMSEPGYNYRLSDINCALGLSQLAKLDRFVARRAALVSAYRRALAGLAPRIAVVPERGHGQPAWHLLVALMAFDRIGLSRAQVMRRLHRHGVGSQVHYLPLHRQPYYARRYGPQDLPGAESFYRRCLSLPLYPAMTDGDVERIATALAGLAEQG
jgi:UDP-4-amino-4,6-dideoxy-N-acetyl-beta-L-altrosamine transaminase